MDGTKYILWIKYGISSEDTKHSFKYVRSTNVLSNET